MSNHTSGPWDIANFDENLISIDCQKGAIAKLSRPNVGFGAPTTKLEALGNATLIAAAPDLLTAIKGLMHAFKKSDIQTRLLALEIAGKAITKAEGK